MAADADVIVAGAGMAGATLALALASGGAKVILIDQTPLETRVAPEFDGRASAIAFSAFRQWRAIGAAPFIEPHAQRIEQILVTEGRAPGAAGSGAAPAFLRFAAAELADRNADEPLGYMVENRHIRAGLARALAQAGVETLAPARIEGVETERTEAAMRLVGGRRLTASVIAAADGRGSRLRAEAGIGVVGWSYPQAAVVATVAVERDHRGVAYEHFLPSGPFAILPLPGRRVSLVWTERAARAAALAAATDGAFAALLKRRFGDFLGALRPAGPRFVHPLSLQLAEAMVAPRLALVGDAAHAIHPIAGQGLNMGLKDAAALAQVAVDAIRRGEDPGDRTVLERYARWRSVDNVGVAVATDVFTRLFSNDRPWLRAARGAGMALVNQIGPARRFFMQEAGGASGDLPRLLAGEAL